MFTPDQEQRFARSLADARAIVTSYYPIDLRLDCGLRSQLKPPDIQMSMLALMRVRHSRMNKKPLEGTSNQVYQAGMLNTDRGNIPVFVFIDGNPLTNAHYYDDIQKAREHSAFDFLTWDGIMP